jgi:UDP-N-acetylglucosamine transferase subunit ALG13
VIEPALEVRATPAGTAEVEPAPPLVFVTVGAAHYQFNRLFGWIETWLATEAGHSVRCVVQHGVSARPAGAEHHDYLPFTEVLEMFEHAQAVVCHGGPGSITLARRHGVQPIVVPRLRSLGECVDDHQVAFARRMAALGQVEIAESKERLHELLDAAVRGGLTATGEATAVVAPEAVRRFEDLIHVLVHERPPRRRARRRWSGAGPAT